MTTNYNQLVIGVFDRDVDAKRVLDELLQLGLDKDQLGFAWRDSNAATATLRRDLINLGVSADAATYYDNQYNAGHPIVSVDARHREPEVVAILRRYGAIKESSDIAAANQARAYNAGAVSNQPAPPPAYNAPTENPPAYGAPISNQPAYGAPISNQPENAPTYKAPEPTKADNAPAFGSATGAAGASTYGTRDQKEVYQAQPPVSKEQTPQEAYPAQPSVSKEQISRETYSAQPSVSKEQISNAPMGENKSMNVPGGEEKIDVIRETRMSGEVDISGRPVQESQRIREDVRREEILPDNAAEASKNVRPDSKPGLKNPLDRVKEYIDEKLPFDDKRASSGPDNQPNP